MLVYLKEWVNKILTISNENNSHGVLDICVLRSCPDTDINPFFPQTILNIKFSYFVEEKNDL